MKKIVLIQTIYNIIIQIQQTIHFRTDNASRDQKVEKNIKNITIFDLKNHIYTF